LRHIEFSECRSLKLFSRYHQPFQLCPDQEMRQIIAVLLGFTLFLLSALPAEAALCRRTAERTLCIMEIKRSAKNFWEYRAIVSVDGKTRPIELYNCRDLVRVRADGRVVPFTESGAGELICRALNRG
jgi:hypothetical protein